MAEAVEHRFEALEARVKALEAELMQARAPGAKPPKIDLSPRQMDVDCDGDDRSLLSAEQNSCNESSEEDSNNKSFLTLLEDMASGNCGLRRRTLSRDEMLADVTSEELTNDERYSINESVWDSSVFVGLKCCGIGPSVMLVTLVLLNMFTQGFFCWIVSNFMIDDPFSTDRLDGLLRFRATVAHSIRYADHTDMRSLASQVCDHEQKLPWAGAQLGVMDQVESVLGNDPSMRGVGFLSLCGLALVCWLAPMVGELESTIHFGISLAALPRGPTRVMRSVSDEERGPAVLRSISCTRLVLVWTLVVVPRLTIALILTAQGCVWLCRTAELGDLLLNAMALAFIIDIDEVFFRVFAPLRVRTLVSDLEPLSIPLGRLHRSKPCFTGWLKLGMSVLVLVWIWTSCLQPFYGRVILAHQILCSGNQDFVYAINPASGIIEATPSFPGSKSSSPEDPDSEGGSLSLDGMGGDDGAGADGAGAGDQEWALQARRMSEHSRSQNRNRATLLRLAHPDLEVRDGWTTSTRLFKVLHPADSLRTAILVLGPEDVRLKAARGWSTKDMLNTTLEEWKPALPAFQRVLELSVATVADAGLFKACADVVPAQSRAIFYRKMQEMFPGRAVNATGLGPGKTCGMFVEDCSLMGRTSLRALCPFTCGCAEPSRPAAAFFAHEEWGCPQTCTGMLEATRQARMKKNLAPLCVDHPPESFLNASEDTLLKKYIVGAAQYLSSNPDWSLSTRLSVKRFRGFLALPPQVSESTIARFVTSKAFLKGVLQGRWEFAPGVPHPRHLSGCDFWASWELQVVWGIDLCNEGHFRSLRNFCPVACGCQPGDRECPIMCGVNVPRRLRAPAAMNFRSGGAGSPADLAVHAASVTI